MPNDEQAAREWLAENWCKPPGLYPGIDEDAKKCVAYAASKMDHMEPMRINIAAIEQQIQAFISALHQQAEAVECGLMAANLKLDRIEASQKKIIRSYFFQRFPSGSE